MAVACFHDPVDPLTRWALSLTDQASDLVFLIRYLLFWLQLTGSGHTLNAVRQGW